MNKIDKKTFEDLIRVTRKYYKTGDCDILERRFKDCDLLSYETKIDWSIFADIAKVFIKLKTTDETIEKVMNLLGFELVKESEEDE